MKKLVHGIGFNDIENSSRSNIYSTWVEMLTRCYSRKYQAKKPSYKGCSVCEEWLIFSNFKKWMETQDYLGKQLDKDVLIAGNKIYSPDTCVFVSPKINSMLTHTRSNKGQFPTGVNFNDSTSKKKYISRCCINGKRVHLGRFSTPQEAGKAYREAKSQEIIEVAAEKVTCELLMVLSIMRQIY